MPLYAPAAEVSSGGVSSCLATRTTEQPVSANPTVLVFDAADIHDPDGWHDPAENNTRLTCPSGKGGKVFHLHVSFVFNQVGDAVWRVRIRKNGTTIVGESEEFGSYRALASFFVYLDDGDYVECLIAEAGTTGAIVVGSGDPIFGVMG